MRIEELKWVVRLFETRNLTKASESLNITQPALTQGLKRIEEELGFPLFSRSNKGLEPTEKGLIFEKTAHSITDTYRDFLLNIELYDQNQLDDIIIGLPPFMSSCCSVDVIRNLSKDFSNIKFSIYEGSWEQRLECLRSGKIHMAISIGPFEIPGIRFRNFGGGQLVILLRRGSPVSKYIYEEKGRRYLDPKYLREEPLAMTKSGQASRRIIHNLMIEAGIDVNVKHESCQIETLYAYAHNGISSAIAPIAPSMKKYASGDGIVCYIPEVYKWKYYCFSIAMLSEVYRLIPEKIYKILEKTILDSNYFYSDK